MPHTCFVIFFVWRPAVTIANDWPIAAWDAHQCVVQGFMIADDISDNVQTSWVDCLIKGWVELLMPSNGPQIRFAKQRIHYVLGSRVIVFFIIILRKTYMYSSSIFRLALGNSVLKDTMYICSTWWCQWRRLHTRWRGFFGVFLGAQFSKTEESRNCGHSQFFWFFWFFQIFSEISRYMRNCYVYSLIYL